MSVYAEDRLADHAGPVSDPDPEVPERAKRRSYRARYKLEILAEYETLDRDGKGALLRREGLYSSLISKWRKQRDKGAFDALAAKPRRALVDPVERDNARLRQRVGRLEEELGTASIWRRRQRCTGSYEPKGRCLSVAAKQPIVPVSNPSWSLLARTPCGRGT